MGASRLSGDEVLAALVEWKPDTTEFVVFTQADYELLAGTLTAEQKDLLDGVSCLPLIITDGE
jgi:hypothetical protein